MLEFRVKEVVAANTNENHWNCDTVTGVAILNYIEILDKSADNWTKVLSLTLKDENHSILLPLTIYKTTVVAAEVTAARTAVNIPTTITIIVGILFLNLGRKL